MTSAPDLLSMVLNLLSGMGVLRRRRMFGGIYIYCDDLFIATLQYYQAPPEVFDNRETMQCWAKKALLAARQDANSKNPQRKRPTSAAGKKSKRSRRR